MKPNTKHIDKLITKMIDNNQHTEALLLVAHYISATAKDTLNRDIVSAVYAVIELEKYYGYIPYELKQVREDLKRTISYLLTPEERVKFNAVII